MVNLNANDHSKFQLTTGTGALHQADNSRQPSNTPRIAPYKLSNEDATYATSFSERSAGRMSRDPSSGSGVGQTYNEKTRGPSPRKIQKRPSTARSQGRKSSSKDDEPAIIQNGSHHVSMADSAKAPTPTKRKKSGLGGVIRRIFGRRSVKNRISLPGPVEHRHHVGFARQLLDIELTHSKDPHTFITLPSDLKPHRAASAPSADLLRSSALGSHSPFVLNTQDFRVSDSGVPPQPERPAPERPARPRRASLPSVILSSQEAEVINDAMNSLGLEDGNSQAVDGRDIGFAVTSGSNPKRRSRSVGDYRSSAKEHRMSPIQWRQWRRRSDEIRYWRGSTTEDDHTVIHHLQPEEPSSLEPESSSANPAAETASKTGDESTRPIEAHNQEFNFGLPIDDIHSNEHVGLEERMITLELKLMDLDYAISKLQAGSFSPPSQQQRPAAASIDSAMSTHKRCLSDQPQVQAFKSGGSFADKYPALAYYQNGGTPNTQQGSFSSWNDSTSIQPRARPASIATTLKASGPGQVQSSSTRGSMDRGSRSSITELTIEHYTTLITLIRREQSARMRLEDQVTELQQQIEVLQARSSPPRSRRKQQNLGRHFSPDDVCRPYGLGLDHRQRRGRSSNYSGETDTDDDNFQDVYVTPVERGEFETEDIDGEEGVAF